MLVIISYAINNLLMPIDLKDIFSNSSSSNSSSPTSTNNMYITYITDTYS